MQGLIKVLDYLRISGTLYFAELACVELVKRISLYHENWYLSLVQTLSLSYPAKLLLVLCLCIEDLNSVVVTDYISPQI